MAASRREVEGTALASVEQDTEEAVDASSRKRPAEGVMGDDKEESADKKVKHYCFLIITYKVGSALSKVQEVNIVIAF